MTDAAPVDPSFITCGRLTPRFSIAPVSRATDSSVGRLIKPRENFKCARRFCQDTSSRAPAAQTRQSLWPSGGQRGICSCCQALVIWICCLGTIWDLVRSSAMSRRWGIGLKLNCCRALNDKVSSHLKTPPTFESASF